MTDTERDAVNVDNDQLVEAGDFHGNDIEKKFLQGIDDNLKESPALSQSEEGETQSKENESNTPVTGLDETVIDVIEDDDIEKINSNPDNFIMKFFKENEQIKKMCEVTLSITAFNLIWFILFAYDMFDFDLGLHADSLSGKKKGRELLNLCCEELKKLSVFSYVMTSIIGSIAYTYLGRSSGPVLVTAIYEIRYCTRQIAKKIFMEVLNRYTVDFGQLKEGAFLELSTYANCVVGTVFYSLMVTGFLLSALAFLTIYYDLTFITEFIPQMAINILYTAVGLEFSVAEVSKTIIEYANYSTDVGFLTRIGWVFFTIVLAGAMLFARNYDGGELVVTPIFWSVYVLFAFYKLISKGAERYSLGVITQFSDKDNNVTIPLFFLDAYKSLGSVSLTAFIAVIPFILEAVLVSFIFMSINILISKKEARQLDENIKVNVKNQYDAFYQANAITSVIAAFPIYLQRPLNNLIIKKNITNKEVSIIVSAVLFILSYFYRFLLGCCPFFLKCSFCAYFGMTYLLNHFYKPLDGDHNLIDLVVLLVGTLVSLIFGHLTGFLFAIAITSFINNWVVYEKKRQDENRELLEARFGQPGNEQGEEGELSSDDVPSDILLGQSDDVIVLNFPLDDSEDSVNNLRKVLNRHLRPWTQFDLTQCDFIGEECMDVLLDNVMRFPEVAFEVFTADDSQTYPQGWDVERGNGHFKLHQEE